MEVIQKVTVTAAIPGYEGPFVIEVPSLDGDERKAARQAMWMLISAGHFDPAEGMLPEDCLDRYFTTTKGATI